MIQINITGGNLKIYINGIEQVQDSGFPIIIDGDQVIAPKKPSAAQLKDRQEGAALIQEKYPFLKKSK